MKTDTRTAHTPGPWTVGPLADREDEYENDERVIEGSQGQLIGTAWPVGDADAGPVMREGNARLMAAAPDLLAFVKEVAEARGDMDAGETIDVYDQIRDAAKTLLASVDVHE